MIVKREFQNIECDCCGGLLNEEMWCDDAEVFPGILSENGWKTIGGRHYCQDCWTWDDDDHIQCKDGRKYTEDGELIEEPVDPAEVADGDILYGCECIFIYKGVDRDRKYGGTADAIVYHACTSLIDGHVGIGPKIGVGNFDGVRPRKAYTDERDLLFDRLRAKGYRWAGREKGLIDLFGRNHLKV